ncbi:MAG: BREX-1 system adenine-specific DNA-methyltransferase PglX [Lachnospiraceae bacterium]|nr:BREX-1 system adenine-specific DNA-methyltransferase PglX [Lachnospiraceae bacterium]
MDKSAIRNFAVEARRVLMKTAATEAGFYGVTREECREPVQKGRDFEVYETLAGTQNRIFGDDMKRRQNLVQAVREQGFDQVMEETAYTWFNRIIAIRFMEVNDYLPGRVRVLSSETGSATPDLVTRFLSVDLNMTEEEQERVQRAKEENRYDEAFRLLFIKQCNELNALLPGLFQKTDDYMELLLKLSYTSDGVVRMLVDNIPEDHFNVGTEGQVEIIGWLYQYYNTELKDDTFAKLKEHIKITKERIPAATQIFTPEWIVRYMVENSLGRVWIDHLRALDPSLDEKAKAEEFGWKYYQPQSVQEEDVEEQLVKIRGSYQDLTPQDLLCLDPCMGSGHILVSMFDVLMDIYRSEGFRERDAVFDILEKNIRGLDIDRRAYQLSYFALMMKAKGYNRIFFRGKAMEDGTRQAVEPRVYAIEESDSISRNHMKFFGAALSMEEQEEALDQMGRLLDLFEDAREYGSILKMEDFNWELLERFGDSYGEEGQIHLEMVGIEDTAARLKALLAQGKVMASRYHAVVTNPPYMGSGFGQKLTGYVRNQYFDAKSDMFAVFMEACQEYAKKDGYVAMVTPQSWMFLAVFEKIREKLLGTASLICLAHLGLGAFDDGFGTVTFVLRRRSLNQIGVYVDLTEERDGREKERKLLENPVTYENKLWDFRDMPKKAIAFWCSLAFKNIFASCPSLGDCFSLECGIKNGNNAAFLRGWHEVSLAETNTEKDREKSLRHMKEGTRTWFRCNKGGGYRKWYGNYEYVLDLAWDARNIKALISPGTYRLRRKENYFRETIAWPLVSGSRFSCRFMDSDTLPDVNANMIRIKGDQEYCLMGYMNSKVFNYILGMLNPSLAFPIETVGAAPYREIRDDRIEALVKENIQLSRQDWDSTEKSWDFKMHPLVAISRQQKDLFPHRDHVEIQDCFLLWERECERRFQRVRENEEALNRIFIKAYGLEEELQPQVEDGDISVSLADEGREIRSLISYGVGCMLGRYSLDEEGIRFAGGTLESGENQTYPADADGVIPITDEPYFQDDIVERWEGFVKAAFGEKALDKNMRYVAKVLGTRGNTPKEAIRNYFLHDFYRDHCNAYSVTGSGKRPIYWLFDSGKQDGFKCLIYIHRYHRDLVGTIRSEYLVKTQSAIEYALKNAEYTISTSESAVDRAVAVRKRDKYVKQLAEIRTYYQALSHVALKRIDLDLDDGVKVNYGKFQGIEIGADGEKRQKINLLAKL